MSKPEEKPGDPQAIGREIDEIRKEWERSGGKLQNMEATLLRLAEMRNSIPGIEEVAVKRAGSDGRASFHETVEEFETFTFIEALETFAEDVAAYADRKEQELHDWVLQAYYTAEELARDPANADLIPHLETIRRAYEHDYGRPIPPRPAATEEDGE